MLLGVQVDTPTKKQGKAGSSLAEPAGQDHIKKPNAASAVDDELIDRTAAKAKVMKLIIQGGEVITIWGMGGLGKTTLVRSVYQHEHGDRFQRRAWLTVSRSFSDKEFIGDLLRQLNHEDKREASNPDNDELHSQSDNNPVFKLAKILLENKCLIIFDDLSSIGEWLWIMKLLPTSRNNGSRIIVTTRELNVAKCCSMEEKNIYNLELLNEEDAHQLFKKKVFKDAEEKNDCSRSPEMIEEENLILKKCGGLPLAISTVGSFLASKPKTAVEWRNLNKHINAELEINPELGMIKTVLTSSYDGLPYYLKSCFLYLAIFSEDQEIRWKRLVRRWIAESYARGVRNMTAEEIGNSYITQLISRSMVQQSRGTTRKTERNGFLQLHDLIREIGISQAADENLIITLEGNCNTNTQGRFRHLVVSNNWARDKDAFEIALGFSHLRSLTVFGQWESFFISDKMRLLRVLDLEDTKNITDHHLHQICQLFHLYYLSLRKCYGILRLPNSLGNLKHLQTLDIRDTKIIKMPRTIIKLRKLQYVRVGFVPGHEDHQERSEQWVCAIMRYFSSLVFLICRRFFDRWLYCHCRVLRPDTRSSGCCLGRCCCLGYCRCGNLCWDWLDYLQRILSKVTLKYLLTYLIWSLLFMGFGQLVLLAHCSWIIVKDGFHGLPVFFFKLNPYGVNFPAGIRQLKSLHTLGVVNINRGDAIFEDLKHLTELRKLRVNGLNKNNCDKFLSAIGDHKCLESLLIRSEGTPGLAGCFDGSPRHQNLQSLKLYGNLVSLPKWIEGFENLVKLELRSSNISKHDEAIKFLGKLPNLAVLRLFNGSFSGDRISFGFHHGAFLRLVVLEISLWAITHSYGNTEETSEGTGNVERVIFEQGAAPKLEVLMFSGLYTNGGCFSGLQFLTSLKEFMLHNNKYSHDFVADLRRQLSGNPSGPTLNMYNYDYGNRIRIEKQERVSIRVIRRILEFIGLGPTRSTEPTEPAN